jgi:hypothetical protein
MSKFNEDHTAGVLKGIPVFCVNRIYKTKFTTILNKTRYKFTFDNGYGASIVKFIDKEYSGGADFEMAVLDSIGEPIYTTPITEDIERGDEYYMHELLCKIEALKAGDN